MSNKSIARRLKLNETWPLHLLLLPCVALLVLFCVVPMFGISIAFQDFVPTKGLFGSEFVGLKYFRTLFSLPSFMQVLRNTLFISVVKIVTTMIFSIIFALLLNEIRVNKFKVAVNSLAIFPFFVSWVIMSSIIKTLLFQDGAINGFLMNIGAVESPISFLSKAGWFLGVIIVTNVWKDFGYNSILITAALTNIDPGLYEAAWLDGANRWKQTLHVTLPGIAPIVMMLVILSVGGILNAGFDQIFNLYNNQVLQVAEVIDTYVYKVGIVNSQTSLATAAGLFKSVVSFVMLIISYLLAYKYSDYRIL